MKASIPMFAMLTCLLLVICLQYGTVTVPTASELNCVTPCGDHGNPAPRVSSSGSVGCTCECDPGWLTAPNQPFESYKYCAVAAPTDGSGDGTGNNISPDPGG